MKYYMGVDGGGSKTYALIADEQGNIVGKGSSGNGNHQIDYNEAKRNIGEAVEAALVEAGLKREDIAFAYFGLAGADREADYRILRPMVAELGFPRHDVNCDTIIAMRAGTEQPYGVVLICGTGTNSAGLNPEGEFYQCGGFSYTYGDFGGGGSLCVEAFRTVIRAWDGREAPTLLTDLVLKQLGYDSVEQMFHHYLDEYRTPPIELTKLLFAAAEQGDAAALTILREQGEELGKSARAVITRLGMENQKFDVVLAGSVLTRGDARFVHPYVAAAVKGCAPQASLVRLETEPVVGALWLAFEEYGGKLPDGVHSKLKLITDFKQIGEVSNA